MNKTFISRDIGENQDPMVIMTLSASDPDYGKNGRVRYSIAEEEFVNFPFEISETTGDLRSTRRLDYEDRQIWHFSVIATDSAIDAKSQLSSTAEITIRVIDVDDNTPFAFLWCDPLSAKDQSSLLLNLSSTVPFNATDTEIVKAVKSGIY